MHEAPLLDYLEGQRLRDLGMKLASDASPDWLERARSVAKHLASRNAEVTIEDVYDIVGLPDHKNAAGSLFGGKEWHCVGFAQASRPSRHCGIVRRWALK